MAKTKEIIRRAPFSPKIKEYFRKNNPRNISSSNILFEKANKSSHGNQNNNWGMEKGAVTPIIAIYCTIPSIEAVKPETMLVNIFPPVNPNELNDSPFRITKNNMVVQMGKASPTLLIAQPIIESDIISGK